MAISDFFTSKQTDRVGLSPLTNAHRERQKLFALYWDYYRGRHVKHLKVKPNSVDDNVILNYSKRVINKSVRFLVGKPVLFEIDGGDERSDDEQWLDAVWGSMEERGQLLQQIVKNGSVCGHAFVRFYLPQGNGGLPRIVNLDPSLVDVVTLDDDVEQVVSYRIVWKSGEENNARWKRHRIDLQENGTWTIAEDVHSANNSWSEVDSEPWPWSFPPIVHCQNQTLPNQFWGMSDLEDADTNDAINFTASNVSRILRYHAHPKTIGTGFSARELQNTAVEEFWTISNETARVFNLEMQSDLQSAFAYYQALKTAYGEVTSIPDLDPAKLSVGALSGFALRILYGDLLELTEEKRNTYGAMFSKLNSRILEVSGRGQSVLVANVWTDPLPESGKEEAEELGMDRQHGLSIETYLERRGYDTEREKGRMAEEVAGQANIGEQLLAAFERGG